MAKRGPPGPGWEEIKYKPGYWLDWSDRDNICVRDAAGRLVATDLHVREEDAQRLIREWKEKIAPRH